MIAHDNYLDKSLLKQNRVLTYSPWSILFQDKNMREYFAFRKIEWQSYI